MNHWSSFRSVYTDPDWVSRIIDDALFVEHFGFCEYYPGEQRFVRPEYGQYKQQVLQKISDANDTGRTVFMVIPKNYLSETLHKVGRITGNMILLPTVSDESIRCDGILLGSAEYEYKVLDDLASQLTTAEIIGEYGDPDHCIAYVEHVLKWRNIRVRRDDTCIYMAGQNVPFNGVL